MTNAEAVAAAIQIQGYSADALNKALADAEITGSSTYSSASKNAINMVAVEVLQGMLAVTQMQEGGYSITFSASGIQARINYLSGIESAEPKVMAMHLW